VSSSPPTHFAETEGNGASLPDADPLIDALEPELRQTISGEWLRRSEVELTAAGLSALLVRGLLLDHAGPEVLQLAANSVAEETNHARICLRVAERYAGRALPWPRARRVDEGVFGDAPAAINRLLSLVLHCCINESLATVCLREGLKRAESPTVKEATRALLKDDLNHARIGWAHLASAAVGLGEKAHVAKALPTLLRLGRDGWLREPRALLDSPAHGVLGNPRFPELFQSAVSELILPGFDYVGVDTGLGRAFLSDSRAADSFAL
jgi:hypothetical protein